MWPKAILVPLCLIYDNGRQTIREDARNLIEELCSNGGQLGSGSLMIVLDQRDYMSWVDQDTSTLIQRALGGVRLCMWATCLARCTSETVLIDYDADRIQQARGIGVYVYTLARSQNTTLSRKMWCDCVIAYVFSEMRKDGKATKASEASHACGKCS